VGEGRGGRVETEGQGQGGIPEEVVEEGEEEEGEEEEGEEGEEEGGEGEGGCA